MIVSVGKARKHKEIQNFFFTKGENPTLEAKGWGTNCKRIKNNNRAYYTVVSILNIICFLCANYSILYCIVGKYAVL